MRSDDIWAWADQSSAHMARLPTLVVAKTWNWLLWYVFNHFSFSYQYKCPLKAICSNKLWFIIYWRLNIENNHINWWKCSLLSPVEPVELPLRWNLILSFPFSFIFPLLPPFSLPQSRILTLISMPLPTKLRNLNALMIWTTLQFHLLMNLHLLPALGKNINMGAFKCTILKA